MTATLGQIVPTREAIHLPALAFDPRVQLRDGLDPDLLGFCNGCELEGQEDARYRIVYRIGANCPNWVDVCGDHLAPELRELLSRGSGGSPFAIPAEDVTLWVTSQRSPLPEYTAALRNAA